MTAFYIVLLVLGSYLFGAATTYYFAKTYDLCLETRQCLVCTGIVEVPTTPLESGDSRVVCPACETPLFFKNKWLPHDVDERISIASVFWPLAVPIGLLSRRSDRVRNERIRRRRELEAGEREIEKLLEEKR